MPPDWERIRERDDLTDWVIHWTHYRFIEEKYESSFQVLKLILQCGYLKPSLAPRRSKFGGDDKNTIHGHPAVCFTDQPLSAFVWSHRVLSQYQPYGFAFEKQHLFSYGGRPVFYGDLDLLARLRDDDKYLWARYDPIPTRFDYGCYPLDWTHEREWRARVKSHYFQDWGRTPEDDVPLLLPPAYVDGKFVISFPVILVRTLSEASELHAWLAQLPKYEGSNGFIRKFYDSFGELRILPLDFVSERLKEGDGRWAKLETLPWNEIPGQDM